MRLNLGFASGLIWLSLAVTPNLSAQGPNYHALGQAAFERCEIQEAQKQWILGQMEAQRTGGQALAASMRDLATLYTATWQFPEAAGALASAGPANDSDAVVQLQTRFLSGQLYAAESDFGKASAEIQTAVKLAAGPLGWGEDHPRTATLLSLLGLVDLTGEQYARAGEELRRATGIFSETYGPHHLETVAARERYARLLLAQGRWNDALQQASLAVAAARNLGSSGRIVLADALLTRATVNLAAHRFDSVAANLQESRQITQTIFGTGLHLVPALTAEAELYLQKGDAAQGSILINQALDLYDANPPANWLPAAETLRVAAMIATRRQRSQDASSYLDQALKIASARLGPGSLLSAKLIETRGDLAYAGGDRDRAAADYRQAMDSRRRALTPGHPDLARGLIEIAEVAGLPTEAVDSLYRQALTNIAAETGNDSFGLIPTLERYTSFLRLQKRENDAAEQERLRGRLVGRQE